jgi:hypothetical protein
MPRFDKSISGSSLLCPLTGTGPEINKTKAVRRARFRIIAPTFAWLKEPLYLLFLKV